MPATITRRLVSLADAADALAVSTRTVRRYISDGSWRPYASAVRRCVSRSTRSSGSSTPGPSATGADSRFRSSHRVGSLRSFDLIGRVWMEPAEITTDKQMLLRYAGTCRLCGAELSARQEAVYERASKSVRCVECPTAAVAPEAAPLPAVQPERSAPEGGVAGAAAQREYERRKAKREERVRAQHPKIGGLVLALSDDPQSTTALVIGCQGRDRAGSAARQARVRDNRRHARPAYTGHEGQHRPPRRHGRGSVRRRREALRRQASRTSCRRRHPAAREKLMVGGRDRTKLVHGVLGQVERVRAALDDESIEVSGVLCFIDADWPLIRAAFSTRGVRVVSPRRLSKILDEASGGST